MEIKEQDIFANANDSEEAFSTEPSPVAETPVVEASEPEQPLAQEPTPELKAEDEVPFELKAEEPTIRKKPTQTSRLSNAAEKTPKSEQKQTSVFEQEPELKTVPTPAPEIATQLGEEESPTPLKPSQKKKLTLPKVKLDGITWQLFATFFKIGFVTFGGGYAMIPMIESEVVDKKKWVEKGQFLDLIAIAQTCPGVFAINISTFIGYKLKHNFGACMAALGAALPSFIIILLIATMFTQIQDIPWVAACFRGIRPAVVALIAVPTFNLAKSAKINLTTCWIPILCALLIWALGVNPVFIIIAAALGGYLYGTFLKTK